MAPPNPPFVSTHEFELLNSFDELVNSFDKVNRTRSIPRVLSVPHFAIFEPGNAGSEMSPIIHADL